MSTQDPQQPQPDPQGYQPQGGQDAPGGYDPQASYDPYPGGQPQQPGGSETAYGSAPEQNLDLPGTPQSSAGSYGSAPGAYGSDPAGSYGSAGQPGSYGSAGGYEHTGPIGHDPYAQPGQPAYGQPAAPDPYAQPGTQPQQGYVDYSQYDDPNLQAGYPQQQAYPEPGYGAPAQAAYPQQGYPQQGYPQGGYGMEPYGSYPPAYNAASPSFGPDRPSVDMVTAVKLMFKNYATFYGRASKSEFWWGFAAYAIVLFVLNAVAGIFNAAGATGAWFLFSSLYWLAWLGSVVPMAALMARRLHDTNQSGWLGLIPIANLVFAAGESRETGGKYDDPSGKQPKLP